MRHSFKIYFLAFFLIFAEIVVSSWHHTKMSVLLDSYRPLEILLSTFFFFRFVLLPVLLTGLDFSVLLQTFPFYMVFGYYLSFFFTISHNFEGVHKLEDTTRASNATSGSFLVNQVRFSAHKSIILYIYLRP